jgi:glycosyltransferase involved in cell wall biosynthesis
VNINIIIGFNPFNSSSASGNRWLTLIEGLATLGANIKIIIYGSYLSSNEQKMFGIEETFNNIRYKYIMPRFTHGFWPIRFDVYIGESLRHKTLINKIVNEIKTDDEIIWTDSNYFGFKLASKIRKEKPKCKLFLEMSEFLDIHKYNKGNFLQRWKANKRQKLFENEAFYAYDGIALMTKKLISHYKQFKDPKPEFLHLPMTVDLKRFCNTEYLPAGFTKPYIAFVGVMNDAKDGVDVLIKAFAQISVEITKCNLYLIGGWNYDTPGHQSLINHFHLHDRVFLKGEYKRDQIPAIIKNASLLVLPRPNSKQAQGGFPTKLGEYLATGNPVCATTVGEIPEYLLDGVSVYFAEPGSVDSFANAMRRVFKNPEEAKQIGMNGKIVAETHFNKEIQSKILYNFLVKL